MPPVRPILVWTHRYVGLVIAAFLVVAGLTGSLLAFNRELSALASPALHDLHPPSAGVPLLDPLAMRERALALGAAGADMNYVYLSPKPGDAFVFRDERRRVDVALDPYTGAVIRRVATPPFAERIMPFVYQLHYTLALGDWGFWAFGIVALLWTLDCFVGAFLTFPLRIARRSEHTPPRWMSRWRAAWKVRWTSSPYKLNFDLHRAGGLWIWAALLLFAWSGVGFNLNQVYMPVMHALFAYRADAAMPALAKPQPQPGISWQTARATARRLMSSELGNRGLKPVEENALSYDPGTATFSYMIRSTADRLDRPNGVTAVIFDANTGVVRDFSSPQEEPSGPKVERWLFDLHMGKVWGRPYDIALALIGVAVAGLSVTGIVIWWKKRAARASRRRKARAVRGTAPSRGRRLPLPIPAE